MTTPRCELCNTHQLSTDAEQAMRACQVCADRIGLIPMPPSRRPRAPCDRCNKSSFIRVIPREHSTTRVGDGNAQVSAPMYVTHMPDTYRGFFSSEVKPVAVEESGIGLLEVYVCRGCGATEWYCVDVEKIPIDPHLMTELIEYGDGDGPYR